MPIGAVLCKVRDAIAEEAHARACVLVKDILLPTFVSFYSLPPYQRQALALNKAVLGVVATSVWEDMLRLKSYQPVNVPDKHKQAAYIFKWISRLHPVKPLSDHTDVLKKSILQANAWYALSCAQVYLAIPRLSPDEEDFIVYSSMYRDIHAREWSMLFYLLEQKYQTVRN